MQGNNNRLEHCSYNEFHTPPPLKQEQLEQAWRQVDCLDTLSGCLVNFLSQKLMAATMVHLAVDSKTAS